MKTSIGGVGPGIFYEPRYKSSVVGPRVLIGPTAETNYSWIELSRTKEVLVKIMR